MPKPTRPPKPPKAAMRWGVYNARGVLVGVRTTKSDAANNGEVMFECGYVRRVMVTPIASRRSK